MEADKIKQDTAVRKDKSLEKAVIISNLLWHNPHIPNIDAISGALFTMRIQCEYTQTQYD